MNREIETNNEIYKDANNNKFSNKKSSSYNDNMNSLISLKNWSIATIIG